MYHRRRFACRDRRKTADSTDARAATPFPQEWRWLLDARRPSGLRGCWRSALASPWFALTVDRFNWHEWCRTTLGAEASSPAKYRVVRHIVTVNTLKCR